MFRAVLFLVPLQLYGQSVCVPFSDSTQTIVHSDSRPLFMSKDEFEMKLVSSARSKLARTANGVAVRHDLYLYQEGGRTVTTLAQSGVNQVGSAVFTKECYTIRYDGRKGIITLRADLADHHMSVAAEGRPLPTRNLPNNSNKSKEFLGFTRSQWKSAIPYYVVYAAIILL